MVLALVALLIVLNLYAPARPTVLERGLASAIIALAALPLFMWRLGIDRNIPFMPFVAGVFMAQFALPIFILERYSQGAFGAVLSDEAITAALFFSLIGLIFLFAGYYGPAHLLVERFVPRAKLAWTDARALKIWAYVFGAVGIVVWFGASEIRLPDQFGQFAVFGSELWLVAIAILFGLQLAGNLGIGGKLVLWAVLVPGRFAFGILTGATAQGLVVGVLLVALYASVARKIPWGLIALGALVFFIVRPLQSPFRAATWQGGSMQQASSSDKFGLFSDLVSRTATDDPRARDFLLQFAMHRLSQISIFAEVLRDTPEHVPYWNGQTYRPLMFKMIPRLVYADKPVEMSGSNFGHRYGFISVQNSWTVINLPQMVELYANFGAVGLLFGMIVIGILYRILFAVFVHPAMGFGGVIAAAYICTKFIDIGSGTSLVFGGLPWILCFIALIHLVMSASVFMRQPIAAEEH